jgi:hypothetical protein
MLDRRELDVLPPRQNVVIHHGGVDRASRRLQANLGRRPLGRHLAERETGPGGIDEGAGEFARLHSREEPVGVDLARECLIALSPIRRAVMGAPSLDRGVAVKPGRHLDYSTRRVFLLNEPAVLHASHAVLLLDRDPVVVRRPGGAYATR